MTTNEENLTPMAHAAQNRCFGCGRANAAGLQLEFLLAEDASVVCLATIPDNFEGPQGYLHGGIIATLLDETMSKAVRARGLTAMTRKLEVEFPRPVPSGAPIRMEGRIVSSEGRKHWVQASILNASGSELASGKGLFIEIKARSMDTSRTDTR
jgi:uncharacterized protein (TIGR00369 family)